MNSSNLPLMMGTLLFSGCAAMVGGKGVEVPDARENVVVQDKVPLADGGETPRLWLRNGILSVAFLPELGGKIVHLQDASGREYLSRSAKPYARRTYGKPFGDNSEFDGIDEIFPTLGPCAYPCGPWQGKEVPGHGELFQTPWRQVDGPGVTLVNVSSRFGTVFRRQATLDGDALVLDYVVDNPADAPFHFVYAFHPLFAAGTGSGVAIPDDAEVLISWSSEGWLGKVGSVKAWGSILDADGKPFKDKVFVPDSGRYWKIFSPPLAEGRFVLRHADGSAVEMAWPASILPRYAVWCSEGSTGGLHHLAPEPTGSAIEALDQAYAAGETLVVPAQGTLAWQIRIRIIPATIK
jgi:hypothetical protein